MNDITRTSKERVDPLTDRLRFLSPKAKYKFGKDQYYMVGEVMHEAAREIERLQERNNQWEATAKDRHQSHLACLRGVISLHADDALHIGGTSRNELDQLRALRTSHEPPVLPGVPDVEKVTIEGAAYVRVEWADMFARRLYAENLRLYERARASQPPAHEHVAFIDREDGLTYKVTSDQPFRVLGFEDPSGHRYTVRHSETKEVGQ